MINGGVKFFEENYINTENESIISVSSGSATSNFLLDVNPFTYWRSLGSDDLTTETITLTFPETSTIDRILLVDHNFKQFQIKYDVAGTPTDFSNVVTINNETAALISETDFSYDSSYYEFDAVTTDKIYITIDTTQEADAEKYISQVILTSELGTLNGFPVISVAKSKNAKKKKTITGRTITQKSIETYKFALDFQTYPNGNSSDFDLMMTLFDTDVPFLIWPCGGRVGTQYFRYTLRGFRLKDVVKVQVSEDVKDSYLKNIYINPLNMSVRFEETP